MAVMKNNPVLICKRCGRAYTFFLTTFNDPEGSQLFPLMDGILKEHLCQECKNQRAYYAAQGRQADWEAGRP